MYDLFDSFANKICTLISFLTTFSYVLHYGPLEGSKDGKAKVLTYLDDLPDDTWPESDPKDPFSLVDKVINNNTTSLNSTETVIWNITCAHSKSLLLNVMLTQVEVALAYKCENSLSHRDLLQYIHRNRNNNARRIETMGSQYLYSSMVLSLLVNT